MNIDKLYNDEKLLKEELENYAKQKLLRKVSFAVSLISAHMDKAKHNLKFVNLVLSKDEFNDWAIVGLYYSAYHCALALLANKGYVSKSHEATLLFIVKEYKISKLDAKLIDELAITKNDAEFYTSLKDKRLQASYSTNTLFKTDKVKDYRIKTIEFLNKVEELLERK